MSVTCPVCGAAGDESARFCSACGARMPQPGQSVIDEPPGPASAPGQPVSQAAQGPPGYGAVGYGPAGYGPPVADLGSRLLARLMDAGIVIAALIPLGVLNAVIDATTSPHYDPVRRRFTSGSGSVSTLLRLLALGIVLGYEPFLIATRGATLGKQIMRLRVVRLADGGVPGRGPAITRSLIPLLGVLVCLVGEFFVYLSPVFDSSGRNQGWHDKAAGTVVVRVRR